MKAPQITTSGLKGTIDLPTEMFGVEPNQQLLAQAVRVYRSNLRQGNGSVKTRSDVNLTTKKWYRQKGTGGARHGAKSAHIFVGGGVAHGPSSDQNWRLNLSKTLRKKSLLLALSAQVENVYLCQDLTTLEGKTKQAAQLLAPVLDKKRVLVVIHDLPVAAKRSLNNLPQVGMISAFQLNALHVLHAQALVFTKESLAALEIRFSDQPQVKILDEKVETEAAPKKAAPKKAAVKPAQTAKAEKTEVVAEKAAAKKAAKPAAKKVAAKPAAAKKPAAKKATKVAKTTK